MQTETSPDAGDLPRESGAWGPVLALTLGTFTLVASEFLPVSILTPIAAGFGISEGMAGQSISVSGAFAVLTALTIAPLTRRLDRRLLMLGLTGLMILSAAVGAVAPSFPVLLVSRALIGVAIGGFWSMSAAVVMRLVPDRQVPKALAVLNGGNALALVVAAPTGSVLGDLIGWRGALFCLVPVACAAFAWMWVSLPRLPPRGRRTRGGALRLLGRPIVALGMAGFCLFFIGQFSLYTYVRPFLEIVVRVDTAVVSLVLLMIGATGFLGTILIGFVLDRRLYATLIAIPLVMAGLALVLMLAGSVLAVTVAAFAVWGLLATAAPVGWWTWLARTLPEDAEAGGGLLVATAQVAISLGATLGGLLFDLGGYRATFSLSILFLLGSAFVTLRAARRR